MAFEVLLWFLRIVVLASPVFAAVELVAAFFSKRVRRFVAAHRTGHVVLLFCVLFCVLMLIPLSSTRRH